MKIDNKLIVGREEWCKLSDLDIPAIKARIDSGAKTSSLHAFNIHYFEQDHKKMVEFDIHPVQKNRKITKRCQAEVIDRRIIRSSNGEAEKRYIIKSTVTIGEGSWEIELSLSNRDSMGFRMLLGREAMKDKILVNPDATQCYGDMDEAVVSALYKSSHIDKSGYRIALLASNPELYSNKRIMEAGESLGHEMIFVKVEEAYIMINDGKPAVAYKDGKVLKNIDAVIPRLKPAMTYYGSAITRQFQSGGIFCLNDAYAIKRSRDKLLSLQMMAEKGVPMPATGFANSPKNTEDLMNIVGGAPMIIKLLEGTQGMGVILAETNKSAESVINAFKSLKTNILVQEFVKEANGSDIRCFVIDGKVVGAMMRTAAEGDFRANIHRGGSAKVVKISPEERLMAVHACKIMGLKVGGVDLIRSSRGPLILEVNSSPGLEGIEFATGKDIAHKMIKAVEKHISS